MIVVETQGGLEGVAYALPQETGRGFKKLIHIDAYRLNGARELEQLGWHELLLDPYTLIPIEWPEKVEACILNTARRVTLAYLDEYPRTVAYDT